jgi:hypothetical protein
MKPDPAIFKDMLAKLDLPAEACAYTDDIPEFVEAARALGFQAVQFTAPEALERELMGMGILLYRLGRWEAGTLGGSPYPTRSSGLPGNLIGDCPYLFK